MQYDDLLPFEGIMGVSKLFYDSMGDRDGVGVSCIEAIVSSPCQDQQA